MNAEIEKEITKCVQVLRDGGFILFPSEIGWSIACDAADSVNVTAILDSPEYVLPAVLLDSPGRLNKFVRSLPDAAWDLIEFSTRPLHLVMEEIINYPSEVFRNISEVVFSISLDELTKALTYKFGKPLFSAVLKNTTHPSKTDTILNKSCYVVNLRSGSKANPDNLVIIRFLKGDKFEIIRK